MKRRLTYAIGDIHGRLDLLRGVLRGIADHAEGNSPKLIFLGDYVDRGPDSQGVVELMMALQRDARVVCLKGNHEALMIRALQGGSTSDFHRWMDAGGAETLASYGISGHEEALEKAPTQHLRWMASLPLTSGDGMRIFVHAGLAPHTRFEAQTEETCLWIREKFLRADERGFEAHVVHGHTPAWAGKSEPNAPEVLPHRTNLDTGAYFTGVLTAGVFDADIPGGPVELLMTRQDEDGTIHLDTVLPETLRQADPRPRRGLLRRWRS